MVYIESIAEQMAKEHPIFLVTYEAWGPTHENFQKFGTQIHVLKKPLLRVPFVSHLARVWSIVKFCKQNEISVVYAHYQEANLISAVAQYFSKSKFVLTRHHSDCAYLDNNVKEKIGDKIINRLVKYYIAPSSIVYNQMVNIEKTNPSKVVRIDYGYNFNNFSPPNPDEIERIRKKFSSELLLIQAARFIPEKRHTLLIESIAKLRGTGLDIKLLLLGKGPIEREIKYQVESLELRDSVFFLGYSNKIPNYYAAADLVVHLSISEASNSAIKEAAITGTPVAVCENVGDFSDYIVDNENGFLLSKENPQPELERVIRSAIKDKSKLDLIGQNLKKEVLARFDVERIINQYQTFNKNNIGKI